MSFNGKTPQAIAEALGHRLKQARLNVNLTQAEVAERSGVSRKIVMNAEKGRVQLESLVAIMMALELVDQLDSFLPEPTVSPVQLARLQGRKRQRASAAKTDRDEALPEW